MTGKFARQEHDHRPGDRLAGQDDEQPGGVADEQERDQQDQGSGRDRRRSVPAEPGPDAAQKAEDADAPDSFCDPAANLQYEEAVRYFSRARNLLADGGDWKEAIADAAAADTARHPGGSISDGYVPPVVSHQRGYGQGTLSTGSKYTGYRDAMEICKDIRAELKAATAATYLPAGLTYSITNEKFSGGQAVNVRIQGVSDEDRVDRTELDQRGEYAQRKEAKELEEWVEHYQRL